MVVREVGLADLARRPAHQVTARERFREGKHVPEVLGAAEYHHQPVEAERDAAVGRGAVGEGGDEMLECCEVLLKDLVNDVGLQTSGESREERRRASKSG